MLQWQVNSEFKEGHVVWKGSWDTNTHAALSTVQVSQFPIKEVLTELFQMGLIDREVEMKTTWVSCNARWEGSFKKPHEAPVHLQSCKLEGAYGGVQLEKAALFPFDSELLKMPMELRVQNLQVQPLVEALNRKVLPTVINKLGVWSGQVQYLNKHSWSLNGHLDGGEVVFSNQSVRGKQALRRIHTLAEKVQGMIAAKIDQVEMNDGQFNGVVEFTLNDDWRSGKFRADIDNLILSPGIQLLLMGGGWETLRLNGSGTLQDGELSEWKGTIEVPKLSGQGWGGDKLQVQSKYVPGVFTLEAQLGRMELTPSWRYFTVMKQHVVPESDKIALKDVRTKVEVRKQGGEIVSFTAVDEESGRTWRGRGNWLRDHELVAALSGTVSGKPRTFTVRAEKGLLSMDEQPGAAR